MQIDGLLAPPSRIIHQGIGNPHVLFKKWNPCPLHGRGVHEDVAPAGLWCNEAKALVSIVEFDGSKHSHDLPALMRNRMKTRKRRDIDLQRASLHVWPMRILPAVLMISILGMPVEVRASETRKTNLIYYPVRGTTAKDIKDDIYKNGPKIRGDTKLSFTIPAIKITRKPAQGAETCRYKSYRISSVYSFVLPKLASRKGVASRTLANWNGFARYLHDHENLHRKIWLKCLAEFETEARAMTADKCATLEKAVDQAFENKKLACLKEDQKLDFYHTKEALKTPFLREAFGK